MKKYLLLFSILIANVCGIAALPYKITYITAENGLSRNLIEYIYKDSHGYMWFCSTKGLDRYDGYDFIHFNSRSTANPLPCENVQCVNEDPEGNLWIGTEKGLYVLNYKSGEIKSISKTTGNTAAFLNKPVLFISKDEKGNLWFGYNGGLAKIGFGAKAPLVEEIYRQAGNVYACTFLNDAIMVGIENSVLRLIRTNDNKYKHIEGDWALKSLPGSVNTMLADNEQIWIGTSAGLYCYDSGNEALKHYTTNEGGKKHLTSNSITDLKKDKSGRLLVGTLIGLNIYDFQLDTFTEITSETTGPCCALSNNFVNCLWVENNRIWIGTDKGGVNILEPDNSIFKNIGHDPSNPFSLSRNPVNAIYEDKDGDLFVGNVEGGLSIRKKNTPGFIHSYSQPGNPTSLTHNSVSCICQDSHGDYWLGTWGGGINKMKYADKYNPRFTRFTNNAGNKETLISNFVAALAPDTMNNGLWIGTLNGIDFLDFSTGKFLHILNYLPKEERILYVTGLTIDSKRRLWIGTNRGLSCIYLNHTNLKQNRIRYKTYRYLLTNSQSMINEKINCILEARDKSIWFGSNGNGLYHLTEKNGKAVFENYDEHTGLPDNVIYGIMEDEAGTLWLSSDKGLCAFNFNKNIIRSYTVSDGLRTNQFYWDAYGKGRDGNMYFGHINGITVFNPLKITSGSSSNEVSITRIRILNDDIFPARVKNADDFLDFEGTTLKELQLHESDKAFDIEFSALDYLQGDRIRYAYRLKGFDNNWTEVSADRRFASFTNIKAGSYEFEIKCTNTDGSWSDKIRTLHIDVTPPVYKTWWFILLVIGAIAYGTYRYYTYRITLLRKQEAHLRNLVEKRTHEIEVQKEQLRNQADQLQSNVRSLIEHQDEVSRQNEMLIGQNRQITLQKEELEDLTRKLEEATFDKISFFTNITHEFRTPITLILGPVERALKLSNNPKVLEQLDIVKRNSRLLLSLINQLMDFRKVESGKMELVKTSQNFVEFLNDLILPFEDLVKERGISFQKEYRINPPEFMFDKDNMQKLIGNLLSNAIKFTPDYGNITIIASTYTDRNDKKERLYVAIKDSGKGIPEEELEKVFERFYQSKQNQSYSGYGQSGTGIGLFLCKRIVELHNGHIEALNRQSGGATFRFILPIERRLSTIISVDGKPMEMMVATESTDSIDSEIRKGKPVLLIVEDNPDMRHYIRSFLNTDFNVLEAPNGVAGLEITNRYQPDMIISDIMMPEMDGMEFCKRVKTNFATSHIPVILLTAKSSTDTQIESFHLGADAFLVKPFDEELLKAMIHNLGDKKKRMQMSFSENMDTEALHIDEESPDKKFMDRALKILRENYTNADFDVTEFIEAMGISRSLLHKKLTTLAGQSASRFIRIYRLNMAREIIIKNRTSHSLNISEIAYEVGFNDPKYFTRCFTKHFGIQPSTFLEMDNG